MTRSEWRKGKATLWARKSHLVEKLEVFLAIFALFVLLGGL